MPHIVNAQGLNMPKLGLGTWPMLGEECTRAVVRTLRPCGTRSIDKCERATFDVRPSSQ